ncbi:MAG: DUF3429 domain-containing protein [Wenzhouxiangellaceae bacterium]|nr:DUF3429 domain-containing protein [Wenzhouxiangellaceae bacterium]
MFQRTFRDKRQTAGILGWAGVLPIAVLALTRYLDAPTWLIELLVGYAMVILAFMSGSLWAGALAREEAAPAPLLASNVLVLAGLAALMMPPAGACAWLALLFALHALAEWRWVHRGQPGWYRRLRMTLSTTVVMLLVVAAFPGPYHA